MKALYKQKSPEPGVIVTCLCSFSSCENPATCKDLCKKHYYKLPASLATKRKDYRNNEAKHRNWQLKSIFKISIDEYNRMFELQGGCCGVCGKHQSSLLRRLAVDHDHKTGKVRALICGKCNTGIGLFNDNEDLLIAAAAYLRKFTNV